MPTKDVASVAEVPYFDVSRPFDLMSEEVQKARETSWCGRTDLGLVVLRHAEAKELLKDRRLGFGPYDWPSQHGIDSEVFFRWWNLLLNHREGEDHTRVRKLVNPMLAPKVIEPMIPRFQALTHKLVDEFAVDKNCEFISAFAEPYSARVLTQFIGIPEDEWTDLSDWSADLTLAFGHAIESELARIEAAVTKLYARADVLIADRTDRPGNDVVSRLIAAHLADAESLSAEELRAMVVAVIFGSIDTTKNQLGLALQLFIDHPLQWALLAERPELGSNAVDEAMRFNPTVAWVTRRAMEDFTYQGIEITEGMTLQFLTYAVNTDPRAIGDPTMDIACSRPQHFTFGSGIHHCLGHFLARIDMSVALPILAARMPNPRLTGPVRSLPTSGVTGITHLPVAFD